MIAQPAESSARERRLASALTCLWTECANKAVSPGLLLSMAAVIGEASAVLASPEAPAKDQRCESGLPDCGPVVGYSADDVPLCDRCGAELSKVRR